MKNSSTYENEIKKKYLKDKSVGALKGNLHSLTPNNIRKVCLNILDNNISEKDKTILRIFFNAKIEDDLRSTIRKFDLEKLKPICNFLKKRIGSLQSDDALEIVALIIDFTPRPYNKYSVQGEFKVEDFGDNNDGDSKDADSHINQENVSFVTDDASNKTIIKVKQGNKGIFTWFSNATAANKIIFTLIGCLLVLVPTIYLSKDSVSWMVWQEDHYVEVPFDTEKYELSQLKLYKEERLKYFKKIDVNCDFGFFKKDGTVKVWYGKNQQKELEYFTDLGEHPETGKTLKPISQYMIDKHICDSMN